MEEIKGLFSQAEDWRHEGSVKHKLCDLLILVMVAVVCGITELAELTVCFEKKIEFYKAHSFLQILTAYANESGVTSGQEAISHEDKTKEIPVFQSMPDDPDIKGKPGVKGNVLSALIDDDVCAAVLNCL